MVPLASGAAGAAAPRMRVTVLLPLPVIQTLPPRSMAMPPGVVDPVVYPAEGEMAVPELESWLTVPLAFAIQTRLVPSMATALGTEMPPEVEALDVRGAPWGENSLIPLALAIQASPELSKATLSGLVIVPKPPPVRPALEESALPAESTTLRLLLALPIHTLSANTVKEALAAVML